MAFATLFFWFGRKDYAHILPAELFILKRLFTLKSLQPIFRLSLIFFFVIMFWALFDQIGTSWQIQAFEVLTVLLPDWIPLFGGRDAGVPSRRCMEPAFYPDAYTCVLEIYISRFGKNL